MMTVLKEGFKLYLQTIQVGFVAEALQTSTPEELIIFCRLDLLKLFSLCQSIHYALLCWAIMLELENFYFLPSIGKKIL